MADSSTALSPVLQFRQDLQTKLRDGVRRAIETVLEEELLAALGAAAHERISGRRGYRHGTIERTVTTRVGTRAITVPRARLRDPGWAADRVSAHRLAVAMRDGPDTWMRRCWAATLAASIAAASARISERSWARRTCRRAPYRAW